MFDKSSEFNLKMIKILLNVMRLQIRKYTMPFKLTRLGLTQIGPI
jgi:hypothetical protein